jgi:hypothetical protein
MRSRRVFLDLRAKSRADPGEPIGEGGDHRGVAEIGYRLCRDAVDEPAPFVGIEHRRLAGFHDVLWAADRGGRVHRPRWPVTSQSNRKRMAARCYFTLGADCSCSSFTQAATSNGRMAMSERPRYSHHAEKRLNARA